MTPPVFCSVPRAAMLLGISECAVRRAKDFDPEFPRPVKVPGCGGRVLFSNEEILEWAEKVAARERE